MKRLVVLLLMSLLGTILVIGCSSKKETIVGQEATDFVQKTYYDSTAGYYVATLDATDTTGFAYYSFAGKGVASKLSAFVATPADWDIAFERDQVILNSGESGTGNVVGASLGKVSFAAVTKADTSKVTEWLADGFRYQIDSAIWYDGGTHQIMVPGNVYVMFDATGQHLVKFRVDSTANASQYSFGDIWMTYYYQDTANSNHLSGPTKTGFTATDSGLACFDFSGDSALYPADISTDGDWDICFRAGQSGLDVLQNCAVNGPGDCSVQPAYQTMGNDAHNIDAMMMQDMTAKFFVDETGSVAKDWYNYDLNTHTLSSKEDVYLIKSGTSFYKLMIKGYYGLIKGKKTSALYTFYWSAL